MPENIENLILSYNTPIFSPEMNKYGKSVISPSLAALALEWFPPGVSETPGFQKGGSGEQPIPPGDTSLIGGGGFIESMTTNFEENNACAINSLVIANVWKYCEELKKWPWFKGKSCEEITLILTKEMYKRYNDIVKIDSLKVPKNGVSAGNTATILYPEKKKMMEFYGARPRRKRIFGLTPPTGAPGDPGLGNDTIEMFPTDLQAWIGAGGYAPQPGSGRVVRPPVNSPYGASACCPPTGCVVVVSLNYLNAAGRDSGWGHQVAGVITKCDPLTISCQEHALQGGVLPPVGGYQMTISPPASEAQTRHITGASNPFRIYGGSVIALMTPNSSASALVPNPNGVINSITCFCD